MPMSLSTSDMTRIKRLETGNRTLDIIPFGHQSTILSNTEQKKC